MLQALCLLGMAAIGRILPLLTKATAGWEGTGVTSTLAGARNSQSAPRCEVVPLPDEAGLFSSTAVWPRLGVICSAILRTTMTVVLAMATATATTSLMDL